MKNVIFCAVVIPEILLNKQTNKQTNKQANINKLIN